MISIVIPTRNEAANLPNLLATLRAEEAAHEVIVVDGGSTDGTPAVARASAARVIETAPGRGRQMRSGAAAARGDILLFLHADSVFPRGGLAGIECVLTGNPRLVGGNFRLLFDGDDPFSRWLTGFYAWMRRRGLYYGDSGVFVRRTVYRALGGMRPMALMEDFDFTRRLERTGATCCIAEPALVTSARRFAGRHPAAIVWGWLVIHALYGLGFPPALLARYYDRRGARAGAGHTVRCRERQNTKAGPFKMEPR